MQSREIRPTPRRAGRLFERRMDDIERLLVNNLIHAGLLVYNILLRDDKAIIIDFPQAVDPRTNSNAQMFLQRDVTNLDRYFGRWGVCGNAARLSGDLWRKFQTTQH